MDLAPRAMDGLAYGLEWHSLVGLPRKSDTHKCGNGHHRNFCALIIQSIR